MGRVEGNGVGSRVCLSSMLWLGGCDDGIVCGEGIAFGDDGIVGCKGEITHCEEGIACREAETLGCKAATFPAGISGRSTPRATEGFPSAF